MKIAFLIIFVFLSLSVFSQQAFNNYRNAYDFHILKQELGITMGGAQYIGDLHPFYDYVSPDYTFGIYLKKYFNPYVGYRFQANYLRLSADDKQSNIEAMNIRNLNFQSHVAEIFAAIDVNFFRYSPQGFYNLFTPYLTFGIGGIYFKSSTSLDGKEYDLIDLNTETSSKYLPINIVLPVGFGLKFFMSKKMSLEIELLHRFSFTDRLDDVSTEYRGMDEFEAGSVAQKLQDRSGETGIDPIGEAGSQRGNSTDFDMFQSVNIKFTFNIYRYECP